ncbi:MAG: hypothetical protein M1832_000530 [Thelocarpon impressellum]|nr:MAG: hypothetical protein M1832_000530 [Thelocarpon impressellum]
MARKARHRISYGMQHRFLPFGVVLPLANSPGGHLLGVNGLAVDHDRSILYSGGRDGVICAWDLALDLQPRADPAEHVGPIDDAPSRAEEPTEPTEPTEWRGQVQAHTHWINDIVLAQNKSALVSASSDLTVKVWRPHGEHQGSPQTLGLHSDYVKCLSTPDTHSSWVASGGLDHKICLWDLNGGGKKLEIDVGEGENTAKGSVYALSVNEGILASGGPESIVRVWDPRTGKRITSFVGHTDNVRDVLINQDGDTIITASSDQTVKVWSVTAGRCMHTLTMHNDSVWSLYSDHPQLGVFYSGDRSGTVAKTDTRGAPELDEGLCVAVCQEHEGVSKVVAGGSHVWTATSSSSINRWADVDTLPHVKYAALQRQRRASSGAPRHSRSSSYPQPTSAPHANGQPAKLIPPGSILPLSNTVVFSPTRFRDAESSTPITVASGRNEPEPHCEADDAVASLPVNALPEESIEGQNGLIKHILLNDRRRVLTLDTAGEVVMWDLVKCEPVQSFGKRHLEDVAPEVNTTESVANWCAIDTRTGRLACVLEENYCFDAEMYADEVEPQGGVDFREDQRINLGKWVLRYLFANLIDEEIRRDEAYRNSLSDAWEQGRMGRGNAPASIQLPSSNLLSLQEQVSLGSQTTPRAVNGTQYPPMTPGLAIGIATPAISMPVLGAHSDVTLLTTTEEGSEYERRSSQYSQSRSSTDKSHDYFSSSPNMQAAEMNGKSLAPPSEQEEQRPTNSPSEGDKENQAKETKEGSTIFGKKFRMSFGSKKLGRSPSVDANKPVISDEKVEDSDESTSAVEKDEDTADNLSGVVQEIRRAYLKQIKDSPGQPVLTGIMPSMPSETPVLKPPPLTTVIIQEDRPESGGVADTYRGTVASLGRDGDVVEKAAPTWLGRLLLWNQVPFKETVKVSFVLQPYQDLLPSIASADGSALPKGPDNELLTNYRNSRLNANRMLRARKILAYVAERIETPPEQPDPDALKPEDYLELYCQNQLVPCTMTLATLRAHVWKTGGDVMLYYKSNGRKPIPGEKTPEETTATNTGPESG